MAIITATHEVTPAFRQRIVNEALFMVTLIKELRAKGMPIIGEIAIKSVRYGTLSMANDIATGNFVYSWTGDHSLDDEEL